MRNLKDILEVLVHQHANKDTIKDNNSIYDSIIIGFKKITKKYNTTFYVDDSVLYYKNLYFGVVLNDNNGKEILADIKELITTIKHNNELTAYINSANDRPTLRYKIKTKKEFYYIKEKLSKT